MENKEVIERIYAFDDINGRDGFKIETNQSTYELSISSYRQCCESFGYFSSDCDFDDFIGAIIKSIKVVDDNYSKRLVTFAEQNDNCVEDVCFLVIETTNGTLDFAVYNEHNGYYGHEVYITKTSNFDNSTETFGNCSYL